MSIYVYITRREKPFEDIAEPEWRAIADADPSLREPTENEIGGRRARASHYRIWTGHPTENEVWFIWTDGQIDIKSPDETMIVKALAIAAKLDAHVISEMGEMFNDDGSHRCFVDGEPW